MDTTNQASFPLPDEMIFEICLHLSPVEIGKLRQVSRAFSRIGDDSLLWKKFANSRLELIRQFWKSSTVEDYVAVLHLALDKGLTESKEYLPIALMFSLNILDCGDEKARREALGLIDTLPPKLKGIRSVHELPMALFRRSQSSFTLQKTVETFIRIVNENIVYCAPYEGLVPELMTALLKFEESQANLKPQLAGKLKEAKMFWMRSSNFGRRVGHARVKEILSQLAAALSEEERKKLEEEARKAYFPRHTPPAPAPPPPPPRRNLLRLTCVGFVIALVFAVGAGLVSRFV